MKFSELLRVEDSKDSNMRLSDIGAMGFNTGVTDKTVVVTPHYEIKKGMEMYETSPIVNSGMNQLLNFVIPNKEVKISSSDPKTVEFLEEWHKKRPGILEEYKNIWLTNRMTGNGYLEKYFTQQVGSGKSVLDNVYSINAANRIFVNPNDMNGPTAFIFELLIGTKNFTYAGVVQQPTFYQVTYVKNYQFTMNQVYGFAIPGWKIDHFKSGWSSDNIYGRSQLVAGVDAHNIIREIMSSWDTISKTRQIDQKILSVADTESGLNISQDRLDDLAEVLEDNDKSYTLFNIPLKFVQQDIATSGKYDLMEGVFDILRRMLITSLLPNHLTPWSDSATTQGAEAAMPPLLGRVKAAQNEYIQFLNESVIDELRKTYPELHEDASMVFDEPKIIDDKYYIDKVVTMIDSQLITRETAVEYLKKLGIIDADLIENIEDDDEADEKPKPDEPKQENLKKKTKFTELATTGSLSFNSFKTKLKQKNPALKTNNWKELKSQNIGGHELKLIKSDETVMIFDGLSLLETFDTAVVDEEVYNLAYTNQIKKIRDSFDEFESGESEEDIIVAELEDDIKKELDSQLDKVIKLIDKGGVKKENYTEKFLSLNIMPKIGDLFKDFNLNINKSITRALNKLNVNVQSTGDDDIKPTDTVKQLLDRKKKLMADNIKLKVKDTKDSMIADIKDQLGRGITAGQDISDIKRDIRKKFDYDKDVSWKFNRIVRTSMNTSSKILKLQKYQKMGLEKVKWQSRRDNKVRDQHETMNNRVYDIDKLLKMIADGTIPGGLFNCRCTVRPYS